MLARANVSVDMQDAAVGADEERRTAGNPVRPSTP